MHIPRAHLFDLFGVRLSDTDPAPPKVFRWMIEHMMSFRGVSLARTRQSCLIVIRRIRALRKASGSWSISGTQMRMCLMVAFVPGDKQDTWSRLTPRWRSRQRSRQCSSHRPSAFITISGAASGKVMWPVWMCTAPANIGVPAYVPGVAERFRAPFTSRGCTMLATTGASSQPRTSASNMTPAASP